MIIDKYNSIMQRDEEHRNKWALGLTLSFSALILISFVFYKGYLDFGNNGTLAQENSRKEVATVVSADLAPSPLGSTKETFGAAFSEIGRQFQLFKDSISGVLVPFVTGIEVYERK